MKSLVLKIFFSLSIFFACSVSVSAVSLSCINFPSDLYRGLSGDSVLLLQNYLSVSGYLSATPNGYFGPATFGAVQKFQLKNGISDTGYVGPITRLAIQIKSCEPVKMDPVDDTSTQSPTDTNTTVPRSSVTITSPWEGNDLTLGELYTIRWANKMSINESLVLEDEDGVTKGYVSYFPGVNGEYIWDVGKVSVGNSIETMKVGKYRIRVQDKVKGAYNNDPKSKLFNIIAPTINVSSVRPSSLKADNKSVSVLFGSGFTAGTRVYLDGVYQNPMNIVFTSSDGTVIVFSAPSNTSIGSHRVVIRNEYGSITSSTILKIY
ncbi:MAG: hypothetical protein COV01_00890 [Candidatus Taylorbacteria bacterium CG10_big_fil_rev_8_21_14_0_10_41_48]|uniref:Peptidoglycan binding-like domain-containing protein n=1 Tax=Candidatus Taylorbacteria bacterium CG10_big_fil_rev_8_21_14_0_10_41_48 TaxID=1975024 RepID=A0A2M8LDE1_9BACT|nr:MAG: hypothetical protein COV01_00890 [Candidatus Taylorbacteria bacterium CG10_big_fil_rev_8_21_14_0_10_41_48]